MGNNGSSEGHHHQSSSSSHHTSTTTMASSHAPTSSALHHESSSSSSSSHSDSSSSGASLPRLDTSCVSSFTSQFLNDSANVEFLSKYLPDDSKKKWTLLFSSIKHGQSYNRFLHHVTGYGPTIVIIRDDGGHVFGGYVSETWREAYPKFYGTSSSFVFQLKPDKIVHRPTGYNQNFQYINQKTETLFNGVGMGGQQDFFCWGIAADFEHGQSKGSPNTTFGCQPLGHSTEWMVDSVEVWEVMEPSALSEEQETIRNRKGGVTKSVLHSEDNPDKVITSMLGHEFSAHGVDILEEDDAGSGGGKKKQSIIPVG
eukprot:TRINITY_DN1903_c0_g1_i1.p1 TRINITY_DN1903_c0_g1~~TRINITY_DN1903_c0_g1_i1.p1  ORF type:complete len:313 (+),score=65.16 TRINITY_DN1903_c0_g1_i1:17-955(+)